MTSIFLFLPLSLHATTLYIIGAIIGICSQEHGLIPWKTVSILGFPALSLFFAYSAYSKKYTSFSLAGFLACILIFATLYEKQKQSHSKMKAPKTISSFIVQENESTANPHWPYRLILATPQKGSFYYLYTKKPSPLLVDDTIEATTPIVFKTSYAQSFQTYLLRQNIHGTAFVPNFEATIIHRPKFSLNRWIALKRNSLIANLQPKMPPLIFAFFSSLFLGKTVVNRQLNEYYKPFFKAWGIVHHLARSGLHLALFVFFWYLLLSLLPLPFYFKHSLLLLLCSVYFFLSFPSVSFVRACHIFLLYSICALFNLPINPLHALTLSALALLLYNPSHLFFLDFQLSFYLTFCLLWLNLLDKQRKNFS